MTRRVLSSLCAWCALGLALAGCSPQSTPKQPLVSASPSATENEPKTLCQPFPDRLIDEFKRAYNARDLEALEDLVSADEIEDLVAGAYVGESTFESVEAWARAGWAVGDRINLVGYGAFSPTREGFQMHISRRSTELRERGIERVATTLGATSSGCSIVSLESSEIVQASDEPCAFYEQYAEVEDVADAEPFACRNGTGNYARADHATEWTGDRVLIWGGNRGGLFDYDEVLTDGLVYRLPSNLWSTIPAMPFPAFRPEVSAWTGRELIVIGGKARGVDAAAAAYNPATRKWRGIEFPYDDWAGFEGVWTGSELVLWGGPTHTDDTRRRGAVYDPAINSWRTTSPAPIPGRWWHSLVWTGNEMIALGGGNADSYLLDGAAYDPSTDSWREIAPAPLSPRQWMPIVWTGSEVIVWGGSSFSRSRADGAAYDPYADTWRRLPPAPIERRHYHSAVWTGEEMLVFGGYDYKEVTFDDGAAYAPATNSWRRLPPAPISSRCCHSAVWTGNAMFVFGGTPDLGHTARGDGALYYPSTNRWQRVVPRL